MNKKIKNLVDKIEESVFYGSGITSFFSGAVSIYGIITKNPPLFFNGYGLAWCSNIGGPIIDAILYNLSGKENLSGAFDQFGRNFFLMMSGMGTVLLPYSLYECFYIGNKNLDVCESAFPWVLWGIVNYGAKYLHSEAIKERKDAFL